MEIRIGMVNVARELTFEVNDDEADQIKADLENEMKVAREEDAAAETEYFVFPLRLSALFRSVILDLNCRISPTRYSQFHGVNLCQKGLQNDARSSNNGQQKGGAKRPLC